MVADSSAVHSHASSPAYLLDSRAWSVPCAFQHFRGAAPVPMVRALLPARVGLVRHHRTTFVAHTRRTGGNYVRPEEADTRSKIQNVCGHAAVSGRGAAGAAKCCRCG